MNREFKCKSCSHVWEVTFGDERPQKCPSCNCSDVHRSDSQAGAGRGRGVGMGRGRGHGAGQGKGRRQGVCNWSASADVTKSTAKSDIDLKTPKDKK